MTSAAPPIQASPRSASQDSTPARATRGGLGGGGLAGRAGGGAAWAAGAGVGVGATGLALSTATRAAACIAGVISPGGARTWLGSNGCRIGGAPRRSRSASTSRFSDEPRSCSISSQTARTMIASQSTADPPRAAYRRRKRRAIAKPGAGQNPPGNAQPLFGGQAQGSLDPLVRGSFEAVGI